MNINIFEIATKEKYRFPYKGQISVEDLWDLTAAQLDGVYKTLNAEKKTTDEESLLGHKTAADQRLMIRIEIVKHIFAAKQAEADARKRRAENAEKKRRIMELIAAKEDAALGEMPVDELKKMLLDLDGDSDE